MKPLSPAVAVPLVAAALTLPAAAGINAPSNPLMLTPFEYGEAPDSEHQGIALELIWVDNSDNEENFEIELYFESEQSPPVARFTQVVPNQTIFPIKAGTPPPGSILIFRVRALNSTEGHSEWSNFAQGVLPVTDLAVQSLTFRSGVVGTPIEPLQPVAINATVAAANFLPPGIVLDPDTGTFSGTPTEAGVFRSILRVSDGISQASTIVTFRFEPPPPTLTLQAPLGDQLVTAGSPGISIDLDQHFIYGDVTAFRMATNRGDIDVLLYPDAVPFTVANFRGYATRGDLDNTVFHRSIAEDTAGIDIIQAGWFKPGEAGAYTPVATGAGIPNEAGFPNDRGTIAMAKRNREPDSATSQIFFNISDSPALDTPLNNAGFTVFGRATTPSLAVLDDIHARPTGTYEINLTPDTFDLADWPTNGPIADGAVPGADDLVQVLSVTELDRFVTYSVGDGAAGAATASIEGSTLTLTPNHAGAATFDITATDLDGNTVTTTVTALVAAQLEPAPSLVDAAGETYLAVTFQHTTGDGAPAYEVQHSTGLSAWTTVWQTSDGFGHGNVVSSAPAGDGVTTLTVRAATPFSPDSPGYLRIKTVFDAPAP